MFLNKFKLKGLTCRACVAISKMRVEEIDGVKEIIISQDLREMRVEADRQINIEEARAALDGTPYEITKE